jgi:urea-proton symporter
MTLFQLLTVSMIAYFVLIYAVSRRYSSGFSTTKTSWLLANRSAGLLESSLSAGASWVLGLALFASAGFAYTKGWAGLAWFVVPQTLSLIIFAWFSNKCNQLIPDGFTLSSWMRDHYGKKVGITYQLVLNLVNLGFIVLTFTALTKYLTFLGVDNAPMLTGLVALGTLFYSLYGGMKTNLISSSIQMVFMLLFCAVLLFIAFENGGTNTLLTGIGGKAQISNLLDVNLVWTFGISMFLTSITGIVCNQSYYQKSFSQQNTANTGKSFLIGAAIFTVIPLTLGMLGMMSLGNNTVVNDPTTSHLAYMQAIGGSALVYVFGFVILNCASNALDSYSNAFGSMVAHDLNLSDSRTVLVSRLSMVAIATVGWILSTFNVDLTYIFLTYAVLRVTLFVITILAVTTDRLTASGIFYAVLTISPVAFFLNVYGTVNKIPSANTVAAMIGFFVTPLVALSISKYTNRLNQ